MSMDSDQARYQHLQRPMYPQMQRHPHTPSTSSTTSSLFQSSTSLDSVQSLNAAAASPDPIRSMGIQSAPLPSPSASQPASYFASMAMDHVASNQPTSTPASHLQPPQMRSDGVATFIGQRGGNGGAPETAPFLQDFNLVAEAAKRAEMACLARDLGDVGL